ncbi:MAG TPA: DUF1343 domain-containing protein [Candidatus Hydrogenedentes bacterium]|nr:DUF1343 domain-containing protein [Candidatus Hydrogenedentota bacterium]
MNFDAWLSEAVRRAGAPGAVACAGKEGRTVWQGAYGLKQRVPVQQTASLDTRYDLASLTKVVATTTAVMLLVEEGLLDLDQPVSRWLPLKGLDRFTLRHCITHTTGLPAYRELKTQVGSPVSMLEQIVRLPLEAAPGTRREYSDFGFMLLGMVVEQATGDRLDYFCGERIFGPLGMQKTGFRPAPDVRQECAPTEQDAWRGRLVQGEVHDENAYAMGGIAGHAGLFSTVTDLARFCEALLGGRMVKPETLQMMIRPQWDFYPWQGLGWWLDPPVDWANGFLFSRNAFGHTGWTGTSIWMDPDTGGFAVLLSNTCHPSRKRRDNGTLRRTFYLGAGLYLAPEQSNVFTAADLMQRDRFSVLRKRRGIGVLTNTAAVTARGTPLKDLLEQFDVPVRMWFSPEHGLRRQAEAGEQVESQRASGVPVVSLYGSQDRPTPEQLRGLDLLVVDLPDVGARYYTYPHTLFACMTACAESGVPVMVLDRPNPLGGDVLEGPVAAGPFSPVCWGPAPVRHGMTLGEAAEWFQAWKKIKGLKLEVRRCGNWRRELTYPQCGLAWQAPSPNLPCPESALAYVGACLLEGTNLNEGRGTDNPFLQFGAPWLDAERLLNQLDPSLYAGFALRPVTYTPRSIPGKAVKPTYLDQSCRGVALEVTDWQQARPFRLFVELLRAIRRIHGDMLAFTSHFDALAGGAEIRQQIITGQSMDDMYDEWERQHAAFDATRPKRYPRTPDLLNGMPALPVS